MRRTKFEARTAKRRRGWTLIEAMIAVVIFGAGSTALVQHFQQYQAATARAQTTEGLARVLDQELERVIACDTRACVDHLLAATATVGASRESDSWVRARVTRTAKPGPDGTLEVTIRAAVEGAPEAELTALVRVPR